MKTILSLLLLLSSIGILAQSPAETRSDTLWIEVDKNEHAFILQPIETGITFYQLSNQFGIDISHLNAFNKSVHADDFEIGSQIYIPFTAIRDSIALTPPPCEAYVLCYQVKPKENMFRISRIYFEMQTKDLLNLNQMRRYDLAVDQILTIGYLRKMKHPIFPAGIESDTILIPTDSLILSSENVQVMRSPLDEYRENQIPISSGKGVAYWDKSTEQSNRYYVLHASARLNSIMEIVNPMNQRKVFAKVVGNIPQNSYTKDIQIVVSPAVAKKLGVLDSRFYTTYQYIR